MFPPEFMYFGISKDNFIPWTPIDIATIFRADSLSHTWSDKLIREAFRQRHPDLDAIKEEFKPQLPEYFNFNVTVVNDEDLKAWGQYSNVSLSERYHAAREHVEAAVPPIHSTTSTE